MTTTAQQLRKLAYDIKALLDASPCLNIAGAIIENAVDHLCAIARVHEVNADTLAAKGK